MDTGRTKPWSVPSYFLKERRSITPETALRLARYFGTNAQSWLNLQLSYDLKIAEAELKDRIEREVERMAA